MPTLVTIEVFTNPVEAHLAKGRLEAEGIPAWIAHEHHIWANWSLSQALGGVKVQVQAEQEAQGRTILQQHLAGEYEASLQQEFPDTEPEGCPHCGSKAIQHSIPPAMLLLLILTLGVVGVIFPVRKARHRCHGCGHRWHL